MSQSPYAQLGSEPIQAGPRRTSAMAIISLVIAIVSVVPLLCVFVGSGTLAMIFGGAALMLIHRERGRLGGTGLAAAGIVLGLLVTVVQVVALIVVVKSFGFFKQQLVGPVDESIRAISRGDFTTARKLFTPEADAATTDEMLREFAAKYTSEFGAFRGSPDSLLDVVRSWFGTFEAMTQLGNSAGNVFPYPAHFDKGDVLVIVVFDNQRFQQTQSGGAANLALPTLNIGLLAPDGRSVWINETRPTAGAAQFRFGPPKPSPPPPPPAPPAAPTPSTEPTKPESAGEP